MQIEVQKMEKMNATVLKIHLKVTDRFSAGLFDDKNVAIHKQGDGYVPKFMPGEHYGDYVILDIDLESGNILNWSKPSAAELEEWIKGDDE